VENKNNSSVNVRLLAETSGIKNFSQNIRSDVKTSEVATLVAVIRENNQWSNIFALVTFNLNVSAVSFTVTDFSRGVVVNTVCLTWRYRYA